MTMTEAEFTDVACTVCGCVCDDLRVRVQNNRIVQADRACHLAKPWFLAQESRHPAAARIAGVAVPPAEAVARAAEILRNCRSPLIYGLSRSSTTGQRAAVRLADLLGATIDTTASRCHAPSIMAVQQVGESTCSLGEIRHRADLVVFWGSNPLASHPRHFERYSVDAQGLWAPGGRRDRHVVVVDVKPTATTALADTFLQIERGSDFDVIWTLRSLLRNLPVAPTGASFAALQELAQRLQACRYGIVFFGLGLTRYGVAHANVQALLRLVTDLNRYTRFSARRMRIPGDVAGADSVLCWQTGYPFSVNLARGYPRYNPGEYSANEVLERGEADACLLVGSEGVAGLSSAAVANLRQLPLIVLDYPTVDCPLPPTVAFTTAGYGIHAPGTAYRMDEVPIPLRAVLTSDYPTDAQVLRQITEQLAVPPRSP
jgi:formylmethanofuran dehydrogenase subunit B